MTRLARQQGPETGGGEAGAGSSTPRRGLFITFEGTDGAGKTTQIRLLAARLRALGYEVLETTEPGGTSIGNQIRRILLDPANRELHKTTELLLYFSSRAQNVHERILPALERGAVVVCDRFTDSTLVYQGAGRGLGERVVRMLHEIACGALQPDVTVYLDIDLDTGLARVQARSVDRLDGETRDFHQSVRDAYLAMARTESRFRVVDASPDPETVAAAVWNAIEPSLAGAPGGRRP